jgi:hypothetical protein
MRWLIYAILFVNLAIAAVIGPHVYYNTNTRYVYVGRPYVPEYPCIIMEGPGVKYILPKPCGKIFTEHENQWEPPF